MTDLDFFLTKLQLPSPLQKVTSDFLAQHDIELYCKRDDLIHPIVSGNKWRKLNLSIQEAIEKGKTQIITFGGAFSNHIAATAGACRLAGLASKGIIRGTYVNTNNATLSQAAKLGMEVCLVSKEEYAKKNERVYQEQLLLDNPNSFLVPEGGNNQLGRDGMGVLAKELVPHLPKGSIRIILPIGTGCTFAGLANALPETCHLIGINVLKNKEIEEDISSCIIQDKIRWEVIHDYHFGGYAKANQELINFANDFQRTYKIPLDPIYTAKMFYGIFDMIRHSHLPKGSKIVAIHTGGLQGVGPFNERYPKHKLDVFI